MEGKGYLKAYYGDESGFSLDPCIPYGWQPKGEYIKIVPKKSQKINVFGLLSRDSNLHAYSSTDTFCTGLVIACLAEKITRKTVVVLDNATIHQSDDFKDKIQEWQEKDLYIFHLPTYSPHLNLIETLWRKMKYSWSKPHHYESLDLLADAVEEIISDIGKKLQIEFSGLKYFTKHKLSIN